MRYLGLPLAALVAAQVMSTAAWAQEPPGPVPPGPVTSGTVTLDYRSGTYEDHEYRSAGLAFQSDLGFGSHVEVTLSGRMAGYQEGPLDYWINSAGIAPRYRLGSGLSLGGYYERLGVLNDGTSVALDSYGLTLGYDLGPVEVSAFGGVSEETPAIEGVHLRDLGLGARSDSWRDMQLAGSAMRTQLETNAGEAEVFSYTLGAQYADRSWSVFAGLAQADADDLFGYPVSLRSAGLGAAYDLSGALHLPLEVSLELMRQDYETSGFELTADEIRIGLSIPLGGRSAPPAGSVAAGAFGSTFTGFNARMMSAF